MQKFICGSASRTAFFYLFKSLRDAVYPFHLHNLFPKLLTRHLTRARQHRCGPLLENSSFRIKFSYAKRNEAGGAPSG